MGNDNDIKSQALELSRKYLDLSRNQDTRDHLLKLINKNDDILIEMMLTPLKLDTGGIRSKMGIGFSCINDITVNIIATSLASYYGEIKNILSSQKTQCSNMSKVFIGYDGRYNSSFFALVVAKVFMNDLYEVFVADEPVITPFASFIAKKGICDISIMITASHNSKEYNGVKIFFNTGCQISAPFDKELEKLIQKKEYTTIDCGVYKYYDFSTKRNYIVNFEEIEGIKVMYLNDYLSEYCKDFCTSWTDAADSFLECKQEQTRVLLSVVNGPSYVFMQKMAEMYNLKNVFVFYEPHIKIDPEFKDMTSPNPEKKEVYSKPIEHANKHNIDYVFMFDGDGDRFGMAQQYENEWIFYDSDEIAILLVTAALEIFPKDKLIVMNTLYCNGLMKRLCKDENIRYYRTETGFKNISSKLLREREKHQALFVVAYEDSLGFCIGDSVEKDALPCAVLLSKLLQKEHISFNQIIQKVKENYGSYVTYKKQIICKNPEERLNELRLTFENKKLNYNYDGTKIVVNLGVKIFLRASGTEKMIKTYSSTKNCTYEDLKMIVDALLINERDEVE